MRIDKDTRITIEEIARVCLEREDICNYIGRELDISDEEMSRVYGILEALLNGEEV